MGQGRLQADFGWTCRRIGVPAKKQQDTEQDLPKALFPELHSRARRDAPAVSSAPWNSPGLGRGNPSPCSKWLWENRAPQQTISSTNVLSILSTCLRAVLDAGWFSPSPPGGGIGFANS